MFLNRATSKGLFLSAAALCGIAFSAAGCKPSAPPPHPVARYPRMPLRNVPSFMDRSILQQADLVDTDPLNVSSYGLVAHLRNTGDCTAPTSVRTWMLDQMAKRGFGQQRTGYS